MLSRHIIFTFGRGQGSRQEEEGREGGQRAAMVLRAGKKNARKKKEKRVGISAVRYTPVLLRKQLWVSGPCTHKKLRSKAPTKTDCGEF